MSVDLPNALLKLGLAVVKHYVKKVIGDEVMQEIATTAADISGEDVKAKIDSILANKEGQKQLLKAAKAADQSFKKKCKDKDLRELFTMEHGDLFSVQTAIAGLPESLDDEILRETLFKVFRSELPKRVSDDRVNDGVNLYVECLQSALVPVKDFGLRVLHTELKEIGKDVKGIKADVEFLVKKAKATPQAIADTKKSYARFLVPFPHNPDFVGRDEELSKLHEILQKKESIVGIRPTVLVGLGGIGKTQLAAEYAHAHRDDYPSGVFWLNAINPLLFEFSDLAEKLEMSDRDTPRDKAARKAWDYLDAHPDALVIFDNVLEPSQLNIPFSPDLVPANLRCRRLFTTRQRDFPRTFQSFEVKILPEMAAMKLLLRSRPEVLEEHHPEWGWARIVCAELGWLPLALELASAYLGAYPEVSITGYLERLRTEGSLETVDESEVRAVDLPTRVEEILKAAAAGNLELKHQVAVSATLQTQLKRLDDEDAKLLFRAAGQFPEASWIPIPRLGLLTGIESEAKAGRPSPLSVVLKKLHAVSLIEELSYDRLRLHPLVQEFAARLSLDSFRLEMAERVAAELDDLLRVQERVIRYGIDMTLIDLRTALGFYIENQETQIFRCLSKMERILDRRAHGLRNWNVEEEPDFFLQQILYESLAQNFESWQSQSEAQLNDLNHPYLLKLSPTFSDLAELRTLVGHNDIVNSVTLSSDGQLAISASDDKTLKVWDLTTGRELRTLAGHRGVVTRAALSMDKRLVVSASGDKTIKVWDMPTGLELRTLVGHSDYVQGVALSGDGELAVSASNDMTLKVWDIPSGRELRTLTGHTGSVFCVALSGNGRVAVSASEDKSIKVWDVPTGRELHTLIGHKDLVRCIALSSDGKVIVSASDEQIIKVWSLPTGSELHTFRGEPCVALSSDGRMIIYPSDNKVLKVRDTNTGNEILTLIDHSNWVFGVALSANGKLAVSTSSENNTLKVWDIASAFNTIAVSGNEQRMFSVHGDSVKGIALSANGRLAVSASEDKTLKVWDVSTGYELHTLTSHGDKVNDVALSADGRLAVSAADDETIKVWDVTTGSELRTFTGHNMSEQAIALSADGRLALSVSYYKDIKVWDTSTGRKLYTFTGHSAAVNDIALSANAQFAASASCDKTIKIWDVAKKSNLYTFGEFDDWVEGIALSANGLLCVSISRKSKTLKVWNIPTGSGISTLIGHSGFVEEVALSNNGMLAVSVATDYTLKVWNVAKGQYIVNLPTGVLLTCCAISADGKIIAAGDWSGGIHFWKLIGADELLAKDVRIEKSWLTLKETQVPDREKVESHSHWLSFWMKGLFKSIKK